MDRDDLNKIAETLEGIPVWGCLPGGAAQQAGIRVGDIVLKVNGQRTRHIAEYIAARDLRKDGAEVVVFRNGQETSFELAFRRIPDGPDELEQVAGEIIEQRMMPVGPNTDEGNKKSN